jgi:hypothetical protein
MRIASVCPRCDAKIGLSRIAGSTDAAPPVVWRLSRTAPRRRPCGSDPDRDAGALHAGRRRGGPGAHDGAIVVHPRGRRRRGSRSLRLSCRRHFGRLRRR